MRRTELRRKAPMNRRPPTRSRSRAPKKKVRPVPDMKSNREFWEAQRAAIAGRAGFRCERCGFDLNRTGMEAHHRKLRSQGGPHDLFNLTALCPKCHAWCHANPTGARMTGFIVLAAADPLVRAVQLWDGRTVRLTPDGVYDVVFEDHEGEAG